VPISLALDLMRHGDALPAGAGGDSARKLSPAGIRELERLGLHLSRLGWRPDHVFASPFIRARESAKIVLQHVPDLRVERLDALSPDRDPKDVVAALGEQEIIQGHVVLVGHQPLLGRLATWLTGRGAPALPPGTLMRLELEGPIIAGAAELRWVLRPENVA
jgi:phosphohistidine phosphatase